VVLTQHVADVLTEIALDALAELLDALDVRLVDAPGASGASGGRGLNFFTPFFTWKFQDTSVTRSLISGKVFIGASATGRSRGRSLIRVCTSAAGGR